MATDLVEQLLKRLEPLYVKTGLDWHLTVEVCLTEPVAPMARIYPDGYPDLMRYAAWGDTIEQAILLAGGLVEREVIQGELITPRAPFTNPSDRGPLPWLPKPKDQ